MDVSIVVCTRNRALQLADTLPRFARLKSASRWEVVFVDNASTDATPQLLDAFVETSGLDVLLVREPKAGLSAARNAGWPRARGEVVAFTDDDCYPAPDYVDQLRACFLAPQLGYLGGRVLLFDPNDYPITIQPLAHRVDIPPRSFVRPGLIHGANLALRRGVLERIGNFDERLGAGTALYCGEDLDILTRASGLGFAGAYDPRPTVFHHHRRSTAGEAGRLMAGYDIGRGACYAKALMDGRTRGFYLWPVLRRIGGNLRRGDIAVLGRELSGAWKYIRG